MKIRDWLSVTLLSATAFTWAGSAIAEPALPVKEVTAFKDGHAFVVREGDVAVDKSGEALLDDVPSPVMGTFWAYSANKGVKLVSVTAGQRITPISRTALSIRELIEANPDASVFITETNQARYDAKIIGLLSRSTEELAATSPPGTREQLPQKSDVVLITTSWGTAALPLDRIQSLTFRDPPKKTGPQPEFRNFLRLKLSGEKEQPARSQVGVTYLQKGIRWIPSYQVDLDGKSNAVVKLQATIINEMIDVTNVTLNLVIGVPSFVLKNTLDPMAIQDTAAQLTQYFQAGRVQGQIQGQLAMAQSFDNNGIMSQVPGYANAQNAPSDASAMPADVPSGAKNEDLYVFQLRNITLRKGERMVLPIGEQTVKYRDVFTLDVPFAPPADVNRNYGNQHQMEMARLLNSPKVMHKVRLENGGNQPFTTAPALLFRDGKLLAQSLMTYAAPGASSDLSLTTAVDIQVAKSETETKRTPNALVHEGDSYMRVDLKGQIKLTNRRSATTEIEVRRFVLGQADSADHDGKIEMTNFFEDRDYLPANLPDDGTPWWSLYNWPWWWNRVNGAGRITWNVRLQPGDSIELAYTWHYFWR